MFNDHFQISIVQQLFCRADLHASVSMHDDEERNEETVKSFYIKFIHFISYSVREPEDLKIVLNSEETYEKTLFSSFFFRFGMLSDGGEVYKQHRKALSPLFGSARLRFINPIINRTMTDFMAFFEKRRDSTKEIDFKHIATYFGTTSSLYTVFNINITDYDLLSRIIENVRLIMLKSTIRIVRPWMVCMLIEL